jgi:hypothetical protein
MPWDTQVPFFSSKDRSNILLPGWRVSLIYCKSLSWFMWLEHLLSARPSVTAWVATGKGSTAGSCQPFLHTTTQQRVSFRTFSPCKKPGSGKLGHTAALHTDADKPYSHFLLPNFKTHALSPGRGGRRRREEEEEESKPSLCKRGQERPRRGGNQGSQTTSKSWEM